MIREIIGERYPLLETARIGCLFSDDVKEHGVGVLAKTKIHNEADRLDGKPDATIWLEKSGWQLLAMLPWEKQVRQMRAVLEGQIYGLKVLTWPSDDATVRTDGEGRPLMEKRPVDWLVCGYRAMAERYGADSQEVIEAGLLKERFGELLFGFMSQQDGGTDVVRETFAALLSVGHTEAQAREAIESALAGGRSFAGVAEMVDAIYLERRSAEVHPEAEPDTTARKPRRKPEKAGARA